VQLAAPDVAPPGRRHRAGLSVRKHAAGTMLVPLLQQPAGIAGGQLHASTTILPVGSRAWRNLRYVTATLLADGVAPNHAVPQRLQCRSMDNRHYP